MKIEISKAEEEEARLTGYALGELDADESKAVEALLESSAEARVALEEIRATAALLSAEFSNEPSLSLHEEQVEAITGTGNVVRGSFFSRHGNALSLGAVAACACLFAAVGLKPYLDGLELRSEQAPQEEIAASAAVENLGDAGPEVDQASPLIAGKESGRSFAEGLGAAEEAMDSTGGKAKGITSPAPAPMGERRQLARSADADADAAEELPRPSAGRAKLAAPAAAPAELLDEAPALRDERALPKSVALNQEPMADAAPEAAAGPIPADAVGKPSANAYIAGIAGNEAPSARGITPRPPVTVRAVTESLSFGLEKSDGLVAEERLRKSEPKKSLGTQGEPEAESARVEGRSKSSDEVAEGESYGQLIDNPWVTTWDDGLSTFAIDVDTGTYPNLRRFLKRRASLPPKDAVRIEEMVNYFEYAYPEPQGSAPFSVNMEVASCPWAKDHRLLRVGMRGRGVDVDKRPPSNLVFLIDVSGSMRGDTKLELLKRSMKAMVGQLNEDDRIGIVTYAGDSGVVLEPTHGDQKAKIAGALDQLRAGGSTNGAAGISTAYSLARANFVEGGTNRVILATDGDFNVGVSEDGDLIQMVEERARENVFLTVLGVGEGNLQEHRMEQIADKGNGSYHYLDSEREGEKVLVRGLGATLVTVAKDVIVQVDFNPAEVSKYRLIGYANRSLPDAAINDPAADAGEIGAGHTVTALYELVPADADAEPGADSDTESRYREKGGLVESREMLTLKLKYKQPDSDVQEPAIEVPLIDEGRDWAESSDDFRFAAAVAGFGLLLRESDYAGELNYDLVLELGREGVPEKGGDFGLRSEFIDLVEAAKSLSGTKE